MPGETADTIVRDFIEKDQGVIVYLSDDFGFTRALRNMVSRLIGLRGEVLMPFTTTEAAMRKCTELKDQDVPCVVFIERMINNRPSTDFIIWLGREFPQAKKIVLTWEATQETVAYFFELGVSRVLVKPASANNVIEELAEAISPPMEFKQQMDRCRELLENREYDAALEASDHILMVRPDSARGLAMRGDAFMGIGKVDNAVQAYMAAHEANPIFMAPLIKLAEAFREMEDERALAYLKQLDDISPLNPERKIDIAEEHLRKGEHEQAERYLDQGMKTAEKEVRSMVGDLTQRIVDAVSTVAPNLAVKYLNRVIETKRTLGRDDLVHFNRLGIILRGEGRWAEAVEVYRKAVTIAPEDPVIHYNMGLAHWEGNERMVAMGCFEKALSIDPQFYAGSVGAALNIGSLYMDLRYYEDAQPFFMHVLELDPKNEMARTKLAKARSLAETGHEPVVRKTASKSEDDRVLNLEGLPEPPKKKKKKKKRKPFTNLEI
ncbi:MULTISPECIES: tetratricopeptide repeat protein [unclassified Pseudodesulfovibrio]|uniref:tetratricopeptide repeat protein n=1 Tax=unclassified Pseudodesulfovibrio TaxID=2661612 RepID=UPI000FEB7B3B|nr:MULTISPECIES: tetratricopeptide repeat protein [unclassified Pseudodesulfovibrio]MCJ2165749.1 tetratricopeptide repeat protein [Pseudodesulfovibrio sp. S3-i]RWU02880.1 tetratricopeptide repeat protein [Pseudodesulfovibrio sp. S3]